MWKEYSISSMKHNRATSISIVVAALVSSVLLSLTSAVFYNIWADNARLTNLEGKTNSQLVFLVYIFTMLISCVSLIMIVHNAFEVSMNARMHQIGILQSVGATPRQIKSVLMNEAFVLCSVPILLGLASGVGLCYIFMQFLSNIANPFRDNELVFQYSPVLFLAALAASFFTVWLSARIPARKISRISPLEAIRNGAELPVEKMLKFYVLSTLFGIEGELARKSIYARRKAFRTSTLSLILSFMAFVTFLNMEAISALSTKHTYFEHYKDKWDIMANVSDIGDQQKELLAKIRNIAGVSNCIAYQKTIMYTYLKKDILSKELISIGGLEKLTDKSSDEEKGHLIETPIIILDDESFEKYYNNIQSDNSQNKFGGAGTVVVNSIWDSIHSNRMNREYISYLKAEENVTLQLFADTNSIQKVIPVKVVAYADKMPELREEFRAYSLLQVMSISYYEKIEGALPAGQLHFNIQTDSQENTKNIQNSITKLLHGTCEYKIENRLEEKDFDGAVRKAYRLVVSILCGLLALIGLANVFSNALGQIYQRRREFARYLSVGLSISGVKKVLIMEVLIIGMRPVLISIFLNVPLVLLALNVSMIPLEEFIYNMPVIPIIIFAIFILLSVSIAYYIGGRRICKDNIADTIRDDTMY